MPVTISPWRCNVTVGLLQAPLALLAWPLPFIPETEMGAADGDGAILAGKDFVVNGTNPVPFPFILAGAGEKGANTSGMVQGWVDYDLDCFTFNNTVTRRLISLLASSFGIGLVAP
jgi:hypothetical protein